MPQMNPDDIAAVALTLCKDCKVGPHWEPPATPEFNADEC